MRSWPDTAMGVARLLRRRRACTETDRELDWAKDRLAKLRTRTNEIIFCHNSGCNRMYRNWREVGKKGWGCADIAKICGGGSAALCEKGLHA